MRRSSKLVLQSIADLEEAYSVSITKDLREYQGKTVSMPRVLSVLKTLEKMGFIRSTSVAGSAERNGNRKRVYSLTRWGIRHMETDQTQDITEERQYFYKTSVCNPV